MIWTYWSLPFFFPSIKCFDINSTNLSLFFDWREDDSLELLVHNEHGDVPRCETHEVGDEALIESQKSISLEGARHAINDTGVFACHHSCLCDVEGWAEDASGEASHWGAENVKRNSISDWGVLKYHLLVLIIRCDFSCVDDGVSENVWNNTNPETCNTSSCVSLSVAINCSIVELGLWWISRALALKSNLDEISWISYWNTNSTSCHSCKNLGCECWVLTWLEFTCDQGTHWNVETNSESCEHNLSLKSCSKTIV